MHEKIILYTLNSMLKYNLQSILKPSLILALSSVDNIFEILKNLNATETSNILKNCHLIKFCKAESWFTFEDIIGTMLVLVDYHPQS